MYYVLCIYLLIYSFSVLYRKHSESGVSLERALTHYLLRLRENYELEEGRPASAHKEFLRMYLQFPGRGGFVNTHLLHFLQLVFRLLSKINIQMINWRGTGNIQCVM